MKRKDNIRCTPQSLREAFDDFLVFKQADGLSKKTIETYGHMFHSFCRYLDEDMPISDVTDQVIRGAVTRLANTGVSPNTVRSHTATLKTFFSWCREQGLCDIQIKLYKGVETIPETYTREELEALLKQPNLKTCTFSEYRSWVIVNLLVNNGLRASSIRAIQIRDVSLEKGAIFLRHTKTRKVLTIPLSSTIAAILQRYLRFRGGEPEDYLFCEDSGIQLTELALRRSIERYNRSRGVAKTGLHRFRHTFARIYITEIGGNVFKLQKLLGHSTLAMTKHYAAIYDQDLLDGYDAESPLELFHPKKIRMR